SKARLLEALVRARPLTNCCRLRSLRSLRPTWPGAFVARKRGGAYSSAGGSWARSWWATSATQERYTPFDPLVGRQYSGNRNTKVEAYADRENDRGRRSAT